MHGQQNIKLIRTHVKAIGHFIRILNIGEKEKAIFLI